MSNKREPAASQSNKTTRHCTQLVLFCSLALAYYGFGCRTPGHCQDMAPDKRIGVVMSPWGLVSHEDYWELIVHCQVRNVSEEPLVIDGGPDLHWTWSWSDNRGFAAGTTVPGGGVQGGYQVIFPFAESGKENREVGIRLAIDENEILSLDVPCLLVDERLKLSKEHFSLEKWQSGTFDADVIFRVLGRTEFEGVRFVARFTGGELICRALAAQQSRKTQATQAE